MQGSSLARLRWYSHGRVGQGLDHYKEDKLDGRRRVPEGSAVVARCASGEGPLIS